MHLLLTIFMMMVAVMRHLFFHIDLVLGVMNKIPDVFNKSVNDFVQFNATAIKYTPSFYGWLAWYVKAKDHSA